MKRLATVFVLSVLLPTLVLAWLAIRSLHDQEIVLNSQRALIHQRSADALADDLNLFMDDVRGFFGQLVDELVSEKGIDQLSVEFDDVIRDRWSQASFGCVVTDDGRILSPQASNEDLKAQDFLAANGLFLANKAKAVVYQASEVLGNRIVVTQLEPEKAMTESAGSDFAIDSLEVIKPATSIAAKTEPPKLQSKVAVEEKKLRTSQYTSPVPRSVASNVELKQELDSGTTDEPKPVNAGRVRRNVYPQLETPAQQMQYRVELENEGSGLGGNWSNLDVDSGNLKDLMGDRSEGALSRFLQDGLHILLWKRHEAAPGQVFWAELSLKAIRSDLQKIVEEATMSAANAEACLALLDADGDVVAQTVPGFSTDWKHPFVASEVGEILPHWEVAAYLVDPGIVNRSAQLARLTIWTLVPIMVSVVGFGAFILIRSVNFEMRLARQKTDFVSNVSHELKTPLTSIRMFSDLLSSGRSNEEGKGKKYSEIISKEAARLTRLINTLLDFSRMERGEMRYREGEFDSVELARETVEDYRMQLEAEGCSLNFEDRTERESRICGDRDAVAQVILNLLSNAEKYGCSGGVIIVRAVNSGPNFVSISVLDRGPGIERKAASRIFEKFYRADDSLATGIQGSGLGLTLARQIAEDHGGSLTFENRKGGGSCFTLTLPLRGKPES